MPNECQEMMQKQGMGKSGNAKEAQLKPGQSVNFTFVKQGSDYVIDAIK